MLPKNKMTMFTILKVTYSMLPEPTKRGFSKNLKISVQFVIRFAFIFSLHRRHNSIQTCCMSFVYTQSILYHMENISWQAISLHRWKKKNVQDHILYLKISFVNLAYQVGSESRDGMFKLSRSPGFDSKIPPAYVACVGILKQSMGSRNRVGIGQWYRLARLHRLAKLIPWNRFLGSGGPVRPNLFLLGSQPPQIVLKFQHRLRF